MDRMELQRDSKPDVGTKGSASGAGLKTLGLWWIHHQDQMTEEKNGKNGEGKAPAALDVAVGTGLDSIYCLANRVILII